MVGNYCKTAWRNLSRNKIYSLLNLTGLSVGLAVSFLLLLYVNHEFTYDHHNEKLADIFQVYTNHTTNNEISTGSATPVKVADVLKKDFPEVVQSAVALPLGKKVFTQQKQPVRLETFAASASFASIFTFHFIEGNLQSAFSQVNAIILTRAAAEKLWGRQTAIGKVIKYNNDKLVTVGAIIENLPANASIQFEAFLPWECYLTIEPWLTNDDWYNYNYNTYLLLKPETNITAFNQKLKNVIHTYDAGIKDNHLFAYPFSRTHLYNEFENGIPSGGRIGTVRLFLVMALAILLIACINFMNLSTARSGTRAREIGVRKVLGSPRSTLIAQFLSESLLLAFISLLLAIVLVTMLLPVFNTLVHLQLSIPYHNPYMWLTALAITCLTALLAGSYPAFFLSSFRPVKVLKGYLTHPAGQASLRPRQMLVVTQFSFSVCLILSSIIIFKQIHHVQNRPLGYQHNGLIELPAEGHLLTGFEAFRHKAIQAGAITDGAITGNGINYGAGSTWGVKWPGQLPGEEKIYINQMAVTYHFVSTFGLQLTAGRDFSTGSPSDTDGMLINEAAVKMLRLKNPLNQPVQWQGKERRIKGVVKDFSINNPFDLAKPMLIGFQKDWSANITLRLNAQQPVSESLNKLQAIYKKFNPEYPFDYQFTDAIFAEKFRNETIMGTLATSFTAIAVIISCLGLFGLATFSAERRRKEMGIRKILGATATSIWINLSAEFILLVIISFVIGAVVSGYIMNSWLLQYAYHTTLSIWVFAATIALALLICLVTVSFQALRTANTSLVKSLRAE